MVKNVLIVDDDREDIELFLEAAHAINGQASYQSAFNGVEALGYLLNEKNELPDRIFLDINMPRMNGKELLQELHRHKRLKDIDIVMLSTSNSERDKKEMLQLGASKFIIKPVSVSQLVQLLTPLLK